jgi:hypothetical protein
VRPVPHLSAPARRRAAALGVALLAAAGVVAGCSADEPPDSPAISGEDPGEVTVPTLPPTTTTEATVATDEGDTSATTTTAAP